MAFVSGHWGLVVRRVVVVFVPPQELLLPKGMITLIALKWLFSRVGEDVGLQVSL